MAGTAARDRPYDRPSRIPIQSRHSALCRTFFASRSECRSLARDGSGRCASLTRVRDRTCNQGMATNQGGVIVFPEAPTTARFEVIIAMAARHRLPAIYAFRYQAIAGGLISYGVDIADLFQGAARYVDR